MTKKILKFLTLGITFLFASQVQATTFSFSPVRISVKQGQTFNVNISINPLGVKNYTVKTSLKFPVDLVSLRTWTYANAWMPVRKGSYDYFSNVSGVLVRTAGYPEGFDKITSFGSAQFIAKKSGTGVISFSSDSLALGADNTNLYAGGNQLTMNISPVTQVIPEVIIPPTSVVEAPSSTPEMINQPSDGLVEQLFDIVLTIENSLLNKASDLVSRTQFTSFGTVPTLVNIVYRIESASGREVYTENAEVTVETERIVTKEFKNLDLVSGKYTLFLATTYGDNIQDEFKQAFEVKTTPISEEKVSISFWAIVVTILIIFGGFIYLLIKRKKVQEKNKDE
jgi:hypothetical protein